MSHNLNFTHSKVSFFTVKEKAWHNLGVVLDNPPTSEEAIKIAQLDYQVEKKRNYIKVDDNEIYTINSYSTVRTDTNQILGENLTNKYQVVQNVDAFKVFDDIVESKEAIFETAGALNKGEVIFITAKLPSYIKLPNGDDIVEKYLLLSNSHDGSSSLTIMLTPVRVVCNNTLISALSGASSNKIYLQHNGRINDKISNAKSLLGLINLNYKTIEEDLNRLAKIKVDDETAKQLIAKLILQEKDFIIEQNKVLLNSNISSKSGNAYDLVLESLYSGHGQNLYEGTGLWLFNGISYYYQNVKSYASADRKMDNLYYGGVVNKTVEAFNLINSLC